MILSRYSGLFCGCFSISSASVPHLIIIPHTYSFCVKTAHFNSNQFTHSHGGSITYYYKLFCFKQLSTLLLLSIVFIADATIYYFCNYLFPVICTKNIVDLDVFSKTRPGWSVYQYVDVTIKVLCSYLQALKHFNFFYSKQKIECVFL